MAKFRIKVREFNIVTCTQFHTIAFKTSFKAEISEYGNGTIWVVAISQDAAISIASNYLKGNKKSIIST